MPHLPILGTISNLKHLWMVLGRVEKAHLFWKKQHKATRDQIRRARLLGEDLIREDLCDKDEISALQDQDAPGIPNPHDRHNTSVSQTSKSTRTREGHYRPTRNKPLSIGCTWQNERRAQNKINRVLHSLSQSLHHS